MAAISVTIPDDQLTRVVEALCGAGHWSADTGLTKQQFAKAEVARLLRERVQQYEQRALLQQADVTAAGIAEPQIV